MATQIYFNRWCEPPEIESRSAANEKCCFCEIVFGGNALKYRIGKPHLERANRCRISAEHAVCKSIHLIDRDPHKNESTLTRSMLTYFISNPTVTCW